MMDWTLERTLVIAHRGARSLAPENTIAAAKQAIRAGADMWELDVQLSADGRPVVVHDRTLERTSNVGRVPEFADRAPWPVEAFTLEELRRLDFGSWFVETDPFGRIAAGRVDPRDIEKYRGQTVPTLEEALAFSRDNDIGVNVEIKDLSHLQGGEEVVEKTVRMVEELGLQERVLLSSFNLDYLRRVRELNPGLAAGLIVEKQLTAPLSILRDLGLRAYHPSLRIADPIETAALKDEGFMVNVWTINETRDMVRYIAAGATGIITDFPQRLAKIV